MNARFRGNRYNIRFVQPDEMPKDTNGDCDPPDKPDKAIRIRSTLQKRNRMEVCIHEALHASLWDLDEQAVTETARDVSKLLWSLGYRLKKR